MPPVEDVGRLIVVDFGRESLSQPAPFQEVGTADERRPGEWQQIGYVIKRVIDRVKPNRGPRS